MAINHHNSTVSPNRFILIMISPLSLLLSLLLLAAFVVGDDRPIQQRIALLADGMTVSWSTVGPIDDTPQVVYGLSPKQLDQSMTGFTRHYESSTTWFHHVELHNLKFNTKYYWQVVSKSQSPVLSFTTQPDLSAGDNGNFSVAIYGDMGIDNSDNTLIHLRELAKTKAVDLFWHVGDLSYADDHADTHLTYEHIYEWWMHNMTNIWDETPYMFCPGNHENSGGKNSSVSQKNFTAYRERFHMPFAQSGSTSNMYYSFDYGLVHFINIDTESEFPGAPEGKVSGPFGGDQASWLRGDLEAATANRENVPWIFVGGHRPFWATDGYLKAQMEFFFPIFADFDIDMIFVGHIHYYERMYAISNNGTVCNKDYVQPTCPIYIVTGAAGNIEGLSRTNHTENYTAKLVSDFGLGVLHVNGKESLQWDFIQSKTGDIIDSITVKKSHSKNIGDNNVKTSTF